MSMTISVEEAQAKLKELIHKMACGEEIIITENQQPVAKLVSAPAKPPIKQRPGPFPHVHDEGGHRVRDHTATDDAGRLRGLRTAPVFPIRSTVTHWTA